MSYRMRTNAEADTGFMILESRVRVRVSAGGNPVAGGISHPGSRSTLKGINTPVGTSTLQARIAAKTRSCSRNFC